MDISKGRYWDKGITLVDGCTPCSPGCEHCWSAGMKHRFDGKISKENPFGEALTTPAGRFNGKVVIHSERLSLFAKTRKPTVFAIWNDLFHEGVPDEFRDQIYSAMISAKQHTFLILTKRPQIMAEYMEGCQRGADDVGGQFPWDNIWHGLTVCNQQEADEKIPIFLQVPGKKYLSIEPMLSKINIDKYSDRKPNDETECYHEDAPWLEYIDTVLLGGETGPGARPMQPDWVRSVRDQCAEAGVPFFFKSWGSQIPFSTADGRQIVPWGDYNPKVGGKIGWYLKGKGRILDGKEYDDLPWRTNG